MRETWKYPLGRSNGVSGFLGWGPGTPHMVVSNEAAQNNDGQPDQERQYREPLDGRATPDRIVPILFVLAERDLKNGGGDRSDSHEEHLDPKRNRHEFADGLPDYHQESRREKDAKGARQP